MIFRCFAILPILYEVGCIYAKALASVQLIEIPVFFYPLLPTKPPITFLVFVAIAVFLKVRERIFLRNGKTHEDYLAFLKTNVNSLHFSLFTSICFVVGALVDHLLVIAFTNGISLLVADQTTSVQEMFARATDIVINDLGFGQSGRLVFMVPIVLLFSYTRTHKNQIVDLLIPVLAIIAIVFLYIHALYIAACMLIQNFDKMVSPMIMMLG